jgi:formylglycine-generating enzyme required for sulfatase activity
MKNSFLKFVAVVILLATAAISCITEIRVERVLLTPTPLVLGVDVSATLTAIIMPKDAANQKVTWTSSDNNIATVDKGTVTAKALGTAFITVITEDGGYKATCEVTVIVVPEIEMVFVEGGTFTMGCTDDECDDYEYPAHKVTVNNFYIGKYTVTQEEWLTFISTIQYPYIGDNFPARVNWDETQKFIHKLNIATGKHYRLPTEAEWEFAARGGHNSKGYKYSGSNNIDEVAWYFENTNYGGCPKSVGQKAPNELEIYDMSGNVREWCSDLFGPYTAEAQINPTGSFSGYHHVLRGGCFNDEDKSCRVSHRYVAYSDMWEYMGLRLVLPEE